MAKRIGELLVEAGVLSRQQLEQALFAQRKDGRKLGQLLIELGLVGEVQLTQTLSRQLTVPWVSLYHVDFSRSLLNLVPRAVAEKYSLVPIFLRRARNQGDTLYVAMDDPTNDGAIDEVARASCLPVKPMIACPTDIRAAIRVYYLGEAASDAPTAATHVAPAPAQAAEPVLDVAAEPAQGVSPAPALGVTATETTATIGRFAPREASANSGANKAPKPSTAIATVNGPASLPASLDEDANGKSPMPVQERGAVPNPSSGPISPRPTRDDAASNDAEATPRMRPKMISLTLLDGTTIAVPAPKKPASMPDAATAPIEELRDQLTARDLVSALRAVAHGVDASEILGAEPRWEAMFSTLLSILLRKGLIADWEFIEEFRKI